MYRKTATELKSLIAKKEVSAEEVARYFLNRIHAFDSKVQSLLHILSDRAIARAKAVDAGTISGPLAGVPIIFKDNIHIKGEKTTCASQFLRTYEAPFDATVTRLIEEAGGIILGKANLDEFAMGSSMENSSFHPTYNPWDLLRTPGGSSGGSAAAVAAMLAPLSLGSDTGGSIRQPASFCNLYGFKPTYGTVSRYGLVAFGSSLDQIGPFAHSIDDIELLYDIIGKPCPHDSTSVSRPKSYFPEVKTIGVPFSLLDGIDPDVKEAFLAALKPFHVIEVDLPLIKYAIPIYYILATAEASTNLARFDGIRYGVRAPDAKTLEEIYEFSRDQGFGKEVKRRILLGTYVLSAGYQDAFYRKAQKVRSLLIRDYKKAFTQCDLIAMPTSPTTAFKLGEIQDPLTMYKQDIFTISANLAGVPALSMPIAFSNLPIGMQLQGPQLHDIQVLEGARLFAKHTDAHTKRAPLFDREAP